MHIYRLQLGQGIHSGQFDQLGVRDAKAGILRKDVLRIQRAGLLADKPERVTGYLIGCIRHSLNLDCADRNGDDRNGCGRAYACRFGSLADKFRRLIRL